MAKARFTENGNVKVTMTVEQWDIICSILNNVRLGDRNLPTTHVSDLLISLEPFNNEYQFGELTDVGFSIDVDGDTVIELNGYRNE
jgi:hypothetical protein